MVDTAHYRFFLEFTKTEIVCFFLLQIIVLRVNWHPFRGGASRQTERGRRLTNERRADWVS